MTRKDYQNIATVIAVVRETPAYDAGAAMVARALCAMLQRDNPRFDEGRFLAACRPEQVAV